MTARIISADSHLDIGWMPPDAFTSRAPRAWRDRMPRVVDTDDGPRWVCDGIVLSGVAGVGSRGRPYIPGRWKRADRMAATGLYDDGLMRPGHPEHRLADQDRDGVSAEVIYGIFGVSMQLPDTELAAMVGVVFNEWLAEFCASHPDRYIGLACLPTHDPDAAAKEIARTAALGLRGGIVDHLNAFAPVHDAAWDPVWAAAEEQGYPISLHLSKRYSRHPGAAGGYHLPSGDELVRAALEMTLQQVQSAPECFGVVLGGALDRFPELQIVLGESGIGWIPALLERMDYEYDNEFTAIGLKMKPSEYWHRQMYSTFQLDDVGLHFVDVIGADRVMFASDYPHPDGIWPDSQEIVARHMAHLDEGVREMITYGNAARLYGIA